MALQGPDTPVAVAPEVIEANKKLQDVLSSKDIVMPEDMPSVLGALGDTSNTLSKVDDVNQNTIKKAGREILAKPEGQRTLKDVAILSMFEKLFPIEATVNKQLALTNKPSASIQSLKNPDGTINLKELQKLGDLSPENIKEQFKSLNKGDLKEIIKAIDSLPDALRSKLKETMGTVLDTMIANGYSIEDPKDLDFLKQNGSPALKEFLQTGLKATERTNISTDLNNGKKYVLKNTNNTYTINALISEAGTLPTGLNLSKINTLDTKTATADVQKKAEEMRQAGQGGNMDSIRTMIKGLEKLGGIGKFLALIFGAVFGINDEGDKKEQGPEKGKTNLEKRNILIGMSSKKDRYDISTFFDEKKGEVTGKKEDPKFQEYLKDIYAIIGKEYPKDGKGVEYDDELKKAVITYEASLNIPKVNQTGLLSKSKIDIILKDHIDDKGEIKGKPEAAPVVGTAPAEVVAEKPHPLKEVLGKMKGLTFGQISNTPALVSDLQKALGISDTGKYDIATKEAVKKFQVETLEMKPGIAPTSADGKIGRITIQKFENKFPNGMIKAPEKKP